jgi:hypothetical protein
MGIPANKMLHLGTVRRRREARFWFANSLNFSLASCEIGKESYRVQLPFAWTRFREASDLSSLHPSARSRLPIRIYTQNPTGTSEKVRIDASPGRH